MGSHVPSSLCAPSGQLPPPPAPSSPWSLPPPRVSTHVASLQLRFCVSKSELLVFPAQVPLRAFFQRVPLVGPLSCHCASLVSFFPPGPVRSALPSGPLGSGHAHEPCGHPGVLLLGHLHGILAGTLLLLSLCIEGASVAARRPWHGLQGPLGFHCTRLPWQLVILDSQTLVSCSTLPRGPSCSVLASCLLHGWLLCAPGSWHLLFPPYLCLACSFPSFRSQC